MSHENLFLSPLVTGSCRITSKEHITKALGIFFFFFLKKLRQVSWMHGLQYDYFRRESGASHFDRSSREKPGKSDEDTKDPPRFKAERGSYGGTVVKSDF